MQLWLRAELETSVSKATEMECSPGKGGQFSTGRRWLNVSSLSGTGSGQTERSDDKWKFASTTILLCPADIATPPGPGPPRLAPPGSAWGGRGTMTGSSIWNLCPGADRKHLEFTSTLLKNRDWPSTLMRDFRCWQGGQQTGQGAALSSGEQASAIPGHPFTTLPTEFVDLLP